LFTIVDNEIRVNAALELSPEADKVYTLNIQTDDGHGGTYSQVFNITVTNDPSDDLVIASLPATYNGAGDPNDNDLGINPLGTTVNGSNSTSDILFGGAGNDTLNGLSQDDTLYGGSGNDTLNGGNGTDTLYGGSGTDGVNGDNGGDILIGGYGADTVNPGSGSADIIRYLSLLDTNDTIIGFEVGSDKIDLSAIDANSNVGGAQDFVWGDSQTGQYVEAHSVTWFTSGGNVTVLADTDGDLTTAEFSITLNGITSINESDFIL
jgi:Ca2+-binding RTX toxin-like protein